MKLRLILALLLCAAVCAGCTGKTDNHAETAAQTEPTLKTVTEIEPETEPETGKEPETETEPPASEPSEPNLLFEDNFDGTELDSTKWERCPEWSRQGGIDVWDNDLSYLDGEGHLILRAEWNSDEKKLHSGAVRTCGKFEEAYAYYEASIQFPKAPGTWGAFWMMVGNVSNEDGSAADGVEIDIIESIGNAWNQYNHALHWDGYDSAHQKTGKEMIDEDLYDGEYHTYGLWRTEEAYIFYIDGEESWRVTEDQCDVCPEKGYMKLTVEGADWSGAGTEESINALPADMVVDYVRVYREKP